MSFKTFNAQILIAGNRKDTGEPYGKLALLDAVKEFQRENAAFEIGITETTYVDGFNTVDGYTLVVRNSPFFPKSEFELQTFAMALSKSLVVTLNLYVVVLEFPDETFRYTQNG